MPNTTTTTHPVIEAADAVIRSACLNNTQWREAHAAVFRNEQTGAEFMTVGSISMSEGEARAEAEKLVCQPYIIARIVRVAIVEIPEGE